jgi:hypothetical protein
MVIPLVFILYKKLDIIVLLQGGKLLPLLSQSLSNLQSKGTQAFQTI